MVNEETYDWGRRVRDEELEEVTETFEAFREMEPRDLERGSFDRRVAKLLIVPDGLDPLEHTRNLFRMAGQGYSSNATGSADIYHAAARKLAEKHGFDWKQDVVQAEEDEPTEA